MITKLIKTTKVAYYKSKLYKVDNHSKLKCELYVIISNNIYLFSLK